MDWTKFYDLYAANFRPLNERDGLRNWKEFTDTVDDVELFVSALEELAERYAIAKERGDWQTPPGLYEIRTAYIRKLAEQRRQKENADFASDGAKCGVCRGSRRVIVLSPPRGCDRSTDYPADPARTNFADFRGVEIIACPQCCANQYLGADIRQRVIQRCISDQQPQSDLTDRMIRN